MASTYSPNLRLELIGTGEQQGSWGTTTNTNLGTLLEEAIGGYVSVAVTDGADTTLTTSNGSADQSRNMVINLTGALTGARNVICPAIEKVYIVRNATTGGFAVTFKVSGQTGISIPNGATYVLYVDGTDVRQATGSIASGGTGASTAAGAATNLGLGTGDSPQFAGINVGNATDTTITRSAAGVIAVEGGVIPKENRVNTFTANQIISVTDNTNAALRITQLGTGEAFRVEDSTNPDSTPFVIDASGNVGIGTDSPDKLLDVSGTSTSTTTVGVGISVENLSNTLNTRAGIVFRNFDNYGASIWSPRTGASSGALVFGTNNNAGIAETNIVERMRIDSSGNVGIGKTPVNGLLDVNGAVAATSIEVGNATDTTITRSAAGYIAVEGIDVLLAGKTDTISVGYTLTPYNAGTKSSGTFTPDPALGNYQYYTNGGAHTLAAPSSDCAIDILVINGASGAGAITMSGFKTAGTGASGATYATTANRWWVLSIRRVNGVSTFTWNGPWS